jgi:NAD(P)-dependent dehydrogenase (short-subunit alcohol dehydrogenase family)
MVNVLVTGGSSGFGYVPTQARAQHGHTVFATMRNGGVETAPPPTGFSVAVNNPYVGVQSRAQSALGTWIRSRLTSTRGAEKVSANAPPDRFPEKSATKQVDCSQ